MKAGGGRRFGLGLWWRLPVLVLAGMLAVPVGAAERIGLPSWVNWVPSWVTWSPPAVEATLSAGGAVSVPAEVTLTRLPWLRDVRVQVSPELAEWVTVQPQVIASLQRGQPVPVGLSLRAPAGAGAGVVEGEVFLQRGLWRGLRLGAPLPVRITVAGSAGPGVLLEGEPETSILDATVDRVSRNVYPAEQVSVDEFTGRRVLRTVIQIVFHENATVAEVNGLLTRIGGSITASVAGTRSVVVRIPDPGTLEALEALAAEIAAERFVWTVLLDVAPQTQALPANHAEGSFWDRIAGPLAVGAPAAWNAQGAAKADPPQVIVWDFFGGGKASEVHNSYLGDSSDFNETPKPDFHGYHVLGIIAGTHGGEANDRGHVTGMNPDQTVLKVFDIQLPPGTEPSSLEEEIEIVLDMVKPYAGKVVLNTSLGWYCLEPKDGFCNDPEWLIPQAVTWTEKVRAAGIEDRLLHLTGAGNRKTPPDYALRDAETFWYPTAAALLPLQKQNEDGTTEDVPNLTNTLAVENAAWQKKHLSTGQSHITPYCLSENSFVGGQIAGIGTQVWSHLDANSTAGFLSGTSMATPQVAGLAAYLWSIDDSLTAQDMLKLLIDTASPLPVVTSDPSHTECSDYGQPAPLIDAYAAVLALDRPEALQESGDPNRAKVRLALLDIVDGNGLSGSNDKFDERDLGEWILQLAPENPAHGQLNYSRYDLNGDGFQGGAGTARFDLNIDRAWTSAAYSVNGVNVTLNEDNVTDLEILCYYAYSNLYTVEGDLQQRDQLLQSLCTPAYALLFQRWDFLNNIDFDLYRIDADGNTLVNLTNTPGQINRLDWASDASGARILSPDNTKVLYGTGFGSTAEVWVANLDGSGTIRVSDGSGSARAVGWVGEREEIVFTVGGFYGATYIVEQAGNLKSLLVPGNSCTRVSHTVPGTRKIIVEERDPDPVDGCNPYAERVFALDVDSKVRTPFNAPCSGGECSGGVVAVDPGGTYLYMGWEWENGSKHEVVNLDTLESQVVAGGCGAEYGASRCSYLEGFFSPDGRRLAYVVDPNPGYQILRLYDLESKVDQKLIEVTYANSFRDLSWSGDGRRLALPLVADDFVTSDTLRIFHVENSTASDLPPILGPVVWWPNDEWIAGRDQNGIVAMSADGTEKRHLVFAPLDTIFPRAWFPSP